MIAGRATLLPYLVLLQVGFARPPRYRDAGALLPHRFTLTLPKKGGLFLLHFPSACAAQALPGTLPDGVRTFLYEPRLTAVARPAELNEYSRSLPDGVRVGILSSISFHRERSPG